MQFYGFHGVNPEERTLGQPYVVDLEVELDLGPAGRSDNLADTVSYTQLYRVAQGVMEGAAQEPAGSRRRNHRPTDPGPVSSKGGASASAKAAATHPWFVNRPRRGGNLSNQTFVLSSPILQPQRNLGTGGTRPSNCHPPTGLNIIRPPTRIG